MSCVQLRRAPRRWRHKRRSCGNGADGPRVRNWATAEVRLLAVDPPGNTKVAARR